MNAKIINDEVNEVISVYCAYCGEFLGFAVQKNNGASWECINCQQVNHIQLPEKNDKTIWDWLNDWHKDI